MKESDNKVIQLVGVNEENKKLYLTEEGKYFLQHIEGPVSVISIAGLYRTGKSFLVNELLHKLNNNDLQSSKHKFEVGSTVQSCTKGLNVWGVPYHSSASREKSKNFSYIIVDSEGIGSMEQEYSYDINLLMLIFLISSTVIYNSIGAIDEQSLDQLRVIVNLKKSFTSSSESSSESSSQPRFIWVLRDFALQLINKRGETLTSNQYLEDCLELTNSTSNKEVMKKNEIRQAIKSCLSNRECITFVRPTIKEEELENLHSLPKHKLREEFNEQIDELFGTVFRNDESDIKYLNNQNNCVDGPTLCQMIEYYISEINCNKVPEVKSVWELIQSTKLDELFEECENEYKREMMKVNLSGVEQNEEEIIKRLNEIYEFICEKYERQLPLENLNVYKQFVRFLMKIKDKINSKVIKAFREIRKKRTLKKIRDYVNKNIEFDKIDPCALTEIKEVIESINLKQIAEPEEAYDYILTTIFDIVEIAQEKTIKIKEELTEWEKSKKETEMEKNSKDEELIKLKESYHDALKKISLLKSCTVNDKQELAILRQEFLVLEEKLKQISNEKSEKELQLKQKIDELNEKFKRKHDEASSSMKSLRKENQSLINELEEAKRSLNEYQTEKRKELIFEEKIKQSWDRFEEERTYFKKELSKFKELYHENEEKVRRLAEKEENLEKILRKEREMYGKKEREFCEQLKWMKENYSKTKEAYNQSLNTRIESERILQDVTMRKKNTVMMGQSRMSINGNSNSMCNGEVSKNSNENSSRQAISTNDMLQIEQLTLLCEELKKETEILKIERENEQKDKDILQNEILTLKSKLEIEKSTIEKLEQSLGQKLEQFEQQSKKLQENNEQEKERFYTCLKELENAKEEERQMYEESIMRLLNNIESVDFWKRGQKMSVDYGQGKSNSKPTAKHSMGNTLTGKLNKKYLY